MRGGISTALDHAIACMDSGQEVSTRWLRRRHPKFADAIAEALAVQSALSERLCGPARAGAYRIFDVLGRGGMGAVYLARSADPAVRPATAAVKVMRSSIAAKPAAVARFRREIGAGRRVRHPNVVWTLGGGVDRRRAPPLWHIVLEYVEGETLHDMLAREGPLATGRVRDLLIAAAEGLTAIHDAGLVHRDVKPGNLILSRDGVLKVADLGVVAMPGVRRAGQADGPAFAGSPLYAAPEQFVVGEGALDGRSDLFGLGVTAFELLTGRHPPDDESRARPLRPSEHVAGVPAALDELIAALTEPDRRDRPRSAAETAGALRAGEPVPWLVRRSAMRRLPPDSPVCRAATSARAPFAGRDDALAALGRAWTETVKERRGRVVVVAGVAGSGKSRLAAEGVLRIVASDAPVRVLYGGFDPTSADRAYGAYRDALRGAADDGGLPGLRSACSRWLARTPALAAPFARFLEDAPDASDAALLPRDALVAAIARAFAAEGAAGPSVLIVEDLHSATDEGREVLGAIAAEVADVPMLVVATTREAEPRPDGSLLVELVPTGQVAAHEIVCSALGPGRVADRLARMLDSETDGTPRHIGLVLRHLEAVGRLRRRVNGSWDLLRPDARLPVVPDVRDAVRLALARMTRAERELVEAVAVAGFAPRLSVVAAACGRDESAVLADLTGIERMHGLVRPRSGRAELDHHQTHDVVYAGTSRRRRRRLHTAVAAALGAAGAGSAEFCEHALRGEKPAAAIPHVDRALERLGAAGRDGDGLRLAALVLRRLPGLETARRIRVLVWMATALGHRDPARARSVSARAVAAAERLDDTALLAEAVFVLAKTYEQASDLRRADAQLRRAVELSGSAGAVPIERRATAARALLAVRSARIDDGIEYAERAVALATDDPAAEVEGLHVLFECLYAKGRHDEAFVVAQREERAAERSGSPVHRGLAKLCIGHSFANSGNLADAVTHYERAAVLFRDSGCDRFEAVVLGLSSFPLFALGRWAPARDAAQRSVDLALAIHRPANAIGGCLNLANACIATGELDRALRAAETAFRLVTEIDFPLHRAGAHEVRACIAVALGDHVRAAADLVAARHAWAAVHRPDGVANIGSHVAASLAEQGLHADAVSAARTAVEELTAIAGPSWPTVSLLQLAEVLLGAKRPADAEAALAQMGSLSALQLDADTAFRIGICRALVAGPHDAAAIETVRAGIASASVPTRLRAELALWDLTGDPSHARAAGEVLRTLVEGASPVYRETMIDAVATYRRARDAAGAAAR